MTEMNPNTVPAPVAVSIQVERKPCANCGYGGTEWEGVCPKCRFDTGKPAPTGDTEITKAE